MGRAARPARAWAIPVAVLGWLLLTRLLVAWIHNSHQKHHQKEEDASGA
jgi:hypothetical protein